MCENYSQIFWTPETEAPGLRFQETPTAALWLCTGGPKGGHGAAGHRHCVSLVWDFCQQPHTFRKRTQLLKGIGFVDWDVQKPGCGDLDALIYESICAGPWGQHDYSVWVRTSCGWIVPAGCCPVLWRPSHCQVPGSPWGCLCWMLGLSLLVNPRAQLSFGRQGARVPHSIWLSPEPAPFWPRHFFPLLCSRATKTGWDGFPLLVGSGLYHWESSTTPPSMPGVLWNSQSCPSLHV